MNRADVTELHYITAIANVTSILQNRILSHTLAAELRHDSVAMPEIQAISRDAARKNLSLLIDPLLKRSPETAKRHQNESCTPSP